MYSTRIPKGIKARSKNQRAAVASVNGAGLDAAVVAARQIMRISRRDPRRPSRLAALFTATYPERCDALALHGSFARFASWIPTEEALPQLLGKIEQA